MRSSPKNRSSSTRAQKLKRRKQELFEATADVPELQQEAQECIEQIEASLEKCDKKKPDKQFGEFKAKFQKEIKKSEEFLA